MPHGIPSQGANSNTCMPGGSEACCDGWSCTELPVLRDLSGLLQSLARGAKKVAGFVFVCVEVCLHAYMCILVCTHAHKQPNTSLLSINCRGAGQWCPLHGDSPVRLHLARTHQQGHKVNKRQPLNLVQPDRCKGPKNKKRVHLFLLGCSCAMRLKSGYLHAISGRNHKNCRSSDWYSTSHMQKHTRASQQLKSTQLNGAVKHGEDKGTIRFGWRRRDH